MLKHYPELQKHKMGSKPFLKALANIVCKEVEKNADKLEEILKVINK